MPLTRTAHKAVSPGGAVSALMAQWCLQIPCFSTHPLLIYSKRQLVQDAIIVTPPFQHLTACKQHQQTAATGRQQLPPVFSVQGRLVFAKPAKQAAESRASMQFLHVPSFQLNSAAACGGWHCIGHGRCCCLKRGQTTVCQGRSAVLSPRIVLPHALLALTCRSSCAILCAM